MHRVINIAIAAANSVATWNAVKPGELSLLNLCEAGKPILPSSDLLFSEKCSSIWQRIRETGAGEEESESESFFLQNVELQRCQRLAVSAYICSSKPFKITHLFKTLMCTEYPPPPPPPPPLKVRLDRRHGDRDNPPHQQGSRQPRDAGEKEQLHSI